jgi:hypothetical protein
VDTALGRCAAETVAVVEAGAVEARRLGRSWVGTEHLLFGFAGEHRAAVPDAVASVLPPVTVVRAGLGPVGEVGADGWVERRRRPWGRARRCGAPAGGEDLRLAPRAKEALHNAARHSERRGAAVIEPVDLLLGMVDVARSRANRVLADAGVAPGRVRAAVRDSTGQ